MSTKDEHAVTLQDMVDLAQHFSDPTCVRVAVRQGGPLDDYDEVVANLYQVGYDGDGLLVTIERI